MKKLLLLCSMFTILLSCKKEGKVSENTTMQSDSVMMAADSTVVDTLASITSKNSLPKVKPLNDKADLGKVVFDRNNQVIISFNTQSQMGKILIDEKEYALSKLTFSENNYEISGNGIKITAEGGNFKEMTSDCLYGNFPTVKISLNDKEIHLDNVNVQDCPAY